MNAVGIDVSKGKSMVCVMRSFGEVVLEPFEVLHTAQNLNDLAGKLKALDGETRVVWKPPGITTNQLLSFYTMRVYLFP